MGSEQVAQVLRQCGNRVKLVVTRGPVEETPSAVMSVVLPTVAEQQVNQPVSIKHRNAERNLFFFSFFSYLQYIVYLEQLNILSHISSSLSCILKLRL